MKQLKIKTVNPFKLKGITAALLVTTLTSVFMACTPNGGQVGDSNGEKIISHRPQSDTHFIAIVKLQNKPLLQSKTAEGVDKDLAKAIDAEQTQLIADLQKLSPDIKVLYRYRMVLNGIAVVVPIELKEKLKSSFNVAHVEQESPFTRPEPLDVGSAEAAAITIRNSVKFIGAEKVHGLTSKNEAGTEVAVTGKGIRVGIIDTGIDYTHAMLGGVGTAEAYKSINPSEKTDMYPNSKVVGGIDLVGTEYNSASGDFSKHIPKPDANPLDEAGHGSHVAGTVAGHGDNENTYSGVAPDADLYAIKVFGAKGSTGSAVVIAGLEFAADPNTDLELNDQLDVVNLSLGSPYGLPQILYDEAVKNLSEGGTVVVASAGNSNHLDYIVGSPGVAEQAISVAASVDDSFHNWKFNAIKFVTPKAGDLLSELVESALTKPVAEVGDLKGKLVFAGLADADFSDSLKAELKGNVAFINRGVVTFADKIRRAAEAGAIGVVVANNQPGAPFVMGGDGKYEIPALMIAQDLGATVKAQMALGDVTVLFKTDDKIEKPELIDTLTSFSSKGPRSVDALLKPEISSPGANVISAAMGEGNKAVKMSGTSMAAPHITGVMALLKQRFPHLSTIELKSVLMGHGTTIKDEKKQDYPISMQGAGRVQSYESAMAKVASRDVSVSLGVVALEKQKVLRRQLHLKNISAEKVTVKVALDSTTLKANPASVDLVLEPNEEKDFTMDFVVAVAAMKNPVEEMGGLIRVTENGAEVHRIPVLAVVKKISKVQASQLLVKADSATSADGAVTELTLKNTGVNSGKALLFNLLGKDNRKPSPTSTVSSSAVCDLQAVGYRIVDKVVNGESKKVLQIAAKLYDAMTTWNACELTVLIDSNNDGLAEQELAAIALENVKGLSSATNAGSFYSVLLDAAKVRELRKKYEDDSKSTVSEVALKAAEDYASAQIDRLPVEILNQSSVIMVEADVTLLAKTATGSLNIKVATLIDEPSVTEVDDYLGNKWNKVSLQEKSQAYIGLPLSVTLGAGESKTVDFTKGLGTQDLLVLMPDNKTVASDMIVDEQSQILKAKFQP